MSAVKSAKIRECPACGKGPMLIIDALDKCIRCASPLPNVACDNHLNVAAMWQLSREGVRTLYVCDECEPTYHPALCRVSLT